MRRKFSGIINVAFDVTGRLLILYSSPSKYLKKKWEYNQPVHQLFIEFMEAYASVRRQVVFKIRIEFDIAGKLVRLIK